MDPCHPPPPCNMPSTPAPTYTPETPQGQQGRGRAEPNPYGPTNLILVTSTKPGKACQSCKRRQRGVSRQQAGRQAAGQGWSRTWYLSSGRGTRPAGSPAHSPTDTCSRNRQTDGQDPSAATHGLSTLPAHPSQLPHLCVLLVALAGLSQALACLPAARRACAVSLDHVVGSITEPPLDAVSLIQLIYLQGQARAAVRGRAGDSTATLALPQLSPCWHETPGDAESARLTSLAGKAEKMV